MLAAAGKTVAATPGEAVTALTNAGWLFDVKWDGVRCLGYVDEKRQVRLRSRDGGDLTARFPDVAAALAALPGSTPLVVDGELVCFDADGRLSFPLTHRRAAQATPAAIRHAAATAPATLIAFDLLYDGNDFRRRPLTARLARLGDIAAAGGLVVSPTGLNGPAMLALAEAEHLEGLIAKRPSSRYTPGRGGHWVKIKFTRSLSALVVGTEPGKGVRAATFGALHLELTNDDGTPQPIGKVGSGFTDDMLQLLTERLRAGGDVIVDVTYQEVSPNGQLRFPVFTALRLDLTRADCTTRQLTH
jgi:bifunctional non-homologous end joining protein LigD